MICGLPIDKAEFENGKLARSLSDRILEFLAKNKGSAYLEDDIGVEMMQADGGDPMLQSLTIVGRQTVVLAVLDNLVREGKIIARIPSRMPFYMYNDHSIDSELLDAEETRHRHRG